MLMIELRSSGEFLDADAAAARFDPRAAKPKSLAAPTFR